MRIDCTLLTHWWLCQSFTEVDARDAYNILKIRCNPGPCESFSCGVHKVVSSAVLYSYSDIYPAARSRLRLM